MSARAIDLARAYCSASDAYDGVPPAMIAASLIPLLEDCGAVDPEHALKVDGRLLWLEGESPYRRIQMADGEKPE